MRIIGVTGISGSGTSTAAKILEKEYNGFIISADKLAHEAILKGKTAYDQIIEAFGEGIIGPSGEIDRKALGALAFGNDESPGGIRTQMDKMALLERIIHPQVWNDSLLLINKARESGKYPFVVIDAPLLIESGMHMLCDTVILITASDTLRAERIIARDGLTPEDAARRLAGRVGDEALKPYADVIIENDGALEILREKVGGAVTL
ncbi:MAG: dephospho-CoA kinase [Defluviitaleaceae bacterium]|nr:dephospho-CoA kinase [Defluviitaleaceae bacterium]